MISGNSESDAAYFKDKTYFFFIVAPCILIFTQFIHQQMQIY